ncbi:MAG: thiol:disulfide interchange protein DsbA/DsbL [Betaproteobacteria bacterium]|nr:thiol:disulfide interchange protein DsbA/DsbL [Betaproteobacteria bacterium]
MRGPRVTLSRLLACLALALFAAAGSAQQARYNKDYRLIPQQPVETGDKIEVIDFFWYGCPYCNKLQPALERWRKRIPDDVELRRVPVILKDAWAPHARIYYTLEALNEVERLHQEVYRGYHVEELYMSKPDVMAGWAVRHGIDRQKWLGAYSSPEVENKVQRAKRLTRQYDVDGTPTIVVDGRYLTSGNMSDTLEGMIPILDDLIRIARQKRAEKK